ncbi:MAG: tetratricopeptide repeat protein, partial [Bacteroidetes bacterium]|nr:tetratricopeptide repeat protein [Bacteroidota bacterium]
MKKLLLLTGPILFLMGGPKAQSITEARKMMYYERFDGAAHQLQNIVKADPANTEAWWLLTQTYLRQHKINTIQDSLQYLPAAAAAQPFALCIRGQLALEHNQKDSAEAWFNKALAITKEKDPVILLAIAKAHQDADSGNAQYALSLLDKATKKDKHNPEIYVAEGDAYRKLQDGGQAFKAYQEALNQDSKYAKALYKQGKIFVTQDNAEQYLKYFNDAVAADSSYAPAWYELYYHYYFRDVNKAAEYLNHYIANTDPGVQNDYLVTDL